MHYICDFIFVKSYTYAKIAFNYEYCLLLFINPAFYKI